MPGERSAARAHASRNLPEAIPVAPGDPGRFGTAFGVDVVPFTALVEADCRVPFLHQGRLDWLAVSSAIRALGALAGSSTR